MEAVRSGNPLLTLTSILGSSSLQGLTFFSRNRTLSALSILSPQLDEYMSYPLSPVMPLAYGQGSWGGSMFPGYLPGQPQQANMPVYPQPDWNSLKVDRTGKMVPRKTQLGAAPSQLTINNPASFASNNAQRSGRSTLTDAEQQAAIQAWQAWQQMQSVMNQNPGCMSKCVIS